MSQNLNINLSSVFKKLLNLFKMTVIFSLFSMMFFIFFVLLTQKIEFQDSSLFFAGTQKEISSNFSSTQVSQNQSLKISSFSFYNFSKKTTLFKIEKLQKLIKDHFSKLFSREVNSKPFRPPILYS